MVFKMGMRHYLEENERVEADSGYKHMDPEFCKTPHSKSCSKENKKLMSQIRARHETANKRFKQFAILSRIYRHNIAHHGAVFRSIAVLTQMALEGGESLFQVEYNDEARL